MTILRHVSRDRRGVAAVEFAFVAPLLIILALATADLVQFIRSQFRLDETAVQLGQLVSQCDSISTADEAQFWNYAQQIVGGVGQVTGATATGAVIISAVYSADGKTNKVAWQISTGNPKQGSSVGKQGGTANITENFIVPSGDTLLVTEVYLPLQPWVFSAGFMGNAASTDLNGTTLYLTRAPDASAIQQVPAGNQLACTK
jgi:Flp pilus assembly protein TadG